MQQAARSAKTPEKIEDKDPDLGVSLYIEEMKLSDCRISPKLISLNVLSSFHSTGNFQLPTLTFSMWSQSLYWNNFFQMLLIEFKVQDWTGSVKCIIKAIPVRVYVTCAEQCKLKSELSFAELWNAVHFLVFAAIFCSFSQRKAFGWLSSSDFWTVGDNYEAKRQAAIRKLRKVK